MLSFLKNAFFSEELTITNSVGHDEMPLFVKVPVYTCTRVKLACDFVLACASSKSTTIVYTA